jgi:hypothetical protein
MNLAAHDKVHPQVNAIASNTLMDIKSELVSKSKDAIRKEMVRRIDNFYNHPEQFKVIPSPTIPDGSPIGMDCLEYTN